MRRFGSAPRWIGAVAATLGVIALDSVPAFADHATGAYRGSTARRIGINFVAGEHAVRSFTYAVKYHCSTGRSYLGKPLVDGGRYPIREGRFDARWTSATGATVSEVHRRIRGRRARGTVSRTVRIDTVEQQPDLQGDELCESGVVRFRARSMSVHP